MFFEKYEDIVLNAWNLETPRNVNLYVPSTFSIPARYEVELFTQHLDEITEGELRFSDNGPTYHGYIFEFRDGYAFLQK